MARGGDGRAKPGGTWLRRALWILGWALITVPIARAQLAEVAMAKRMPGQALLLDAGHARALASLSAVLQVQGQQQQAMTLARAALKREPMNVVAARTIGLALEQTGDTAGANRIMFLAGGLGWRDVPLQLWLIRAYALKDDVRASLRRADALARINQLPEVIYPLFMASIEEDRLRAALVQEMADRPLWRGNFFYRVLQLPAGQMPYVEALVADLARAGSPVTAPERAIFLTRLIQVGEGAKAYAYWLRDQRVAPGRAAAWPWDGGFDHVPPAGALSVPFEWRMAPEGTGVAGIVPSPRGGHQLSVARGRDFNGTLLSQTMVLPPGRYRLTARIEGDAASAGLRWTIRCLPENKELSFDAGPDASESGSTTFFIQAEDCKEQSLALDMASTGSGGGSGDVMIDDVRLRKID